MDYPTILRDVQTVHPDRMVNDITVVVHHVRPMHSPMFDHHTHRRAPVLRAPPRATHNKPRTPCPGKEERCLVRRKARGPGMGEFYFLVFNFYIAFCALGVVLARALAPKQKKRACQREKNCITLEIS